MLVELAASRRIRWAVVASETETIEDAGYPAKDMKRPGVQEALWALEAGDAKALVVAYCWAVLLRTAQSRLDGEPY